MNIEKHLFESTKSKILNQMDSVCYISGFQCDRLKKVTESKCTDDNLFEVEIKTKCDDHKTFYFDKNLNLVKVIHQLKEIH